MKGKSSGNNRTQTAEPAGVSLRRGASALLWTASLSGVFFGLRELDAQARQIGTHERAADVRIEFVDVPAWLREPRNRDILEEVAATAEYRGEQGTHSARLCEDVGVSLERSPWLKTVRQVEKRSDGLVRVSATFRAPLTMVVRGGWAYLVDEAGVRLPRQVRIDFVPPADWILLTGSQGAIPKVGETFNGPDVAAGLRLVKTVVERAALGMLRARADLRAVDVSNYKGRVDARDAWIRITTSSPESYIRWGLPPGEEYGIEASAPMKLAVLEELCRRNGGTLPKIGPVDVRNDDRVILGGS
ncbi:MAG: hypothetical protein CHACPFDD_02789 [Phycisphaerae bacterium]|nr:hypothetical protein [Phycisphaerae bacterium]